MIIHYMKYEICKDSTIKKIDNGLICTPYKGRDGYMQVSLIYNDKFVKRKVHRLVAENFIPNPDKKPQVNHLNGKDKNSVSDLEWSTAPENMKHVHECIIQHNVVQVNKIDPITNEILKTYSKVSDVSIDGFSQSKVSLCINGHRNSHGGFKWEKVIDDNNIINNDNTEVKKEICNETWADLKDSIYKEVNEYINYSVSSEGNTKIIKTEKIMKIHNERAKLNKNGIQETFCIHRLILYAFNIQNLENKPEVDHIDSNYKNNKLSNLRWATPKEQMNNEETLKKISFTIEISYPDGKKENVVGIRNVAAKLKTSETTIKNYLSMGNSFKGHALKKIE
jgi:hypothetical protein